MILLRLFFEFCKVGLFSVGGGLATIPFLTDMGIRTGWFTPAQLTDICCLTLIESPFLKRQPLLYACPSRHTCCESAIRSLLSD